MKKYIIITADTNDADYVTSKNFINDEELKLIKPLIQAIKKFKPYTVKNTGYSKNSTFTHNHNFPYNECCREDLGEIDAYTYYKEKCGISEDALDYFREIQPYNEYGIHTIVSIELLEVSKETILL
jgi:hypothetical protein